MPISRVRSVTDTSMMFMMPMPPTSRLTAATAPSNIVIICVVPDSIMAISFMSITLKSSSWFEERCRRRAHQPPNVPFDSLSRGRRPWPKPG